MTAAVCPETTFAALERAAYTVPDLEAVVCGDDRITYGDLHTRVLELRRALTAAGVGRGDHVGLCVGNGSRWMELFYAVTGIGAVIVPINTRYRGAELAHALNDAKCTVLFTAPKVLSSDFIALLREVCPEIDSSLPGAALPHLRQVILTEEADTPAGASSWSSFLAYDAGSVLSVPAAEPDDFALIQYTSGTTARPKGVLLTHRSMCTDAFFSGTRLGLRVGDRFHSVRPFFHVAGSTLSVLSSAQCLATLVTMLRFQPGPALKVMADERCTHFSGNDTIALMLLNEPSRARTRLYLRGAWLAAAPPIVRRVIDELGAPEAVVGYGLSEASPNVAQSSWYEPEDVRVSAAVLPQPGVSVRIWDTESDAESVRGQSGEIQVLGWNVMQGYYDQPEATAAAFTDDGWLRTGDLGFLDQTGRLRFIGRLKELIRVGGENVAPAEIEDLLNGHPAVRIAVVVGVPDERLVEVPCALVQLNASVACTPEELASWVSARISGFKVPRHIHVVENFESIGMTASAKVQRGLAADYARSVVESS